MRSQSPLKLMVLAALALATLATAKNTVAVHETKNTNPIRKVLGMLQDMKDELTHEVEAEKELFDKAMCACDTYEAELTKVIADSNAEISRLTPKIQGDTAEKKKTVTEIATHKADKAATESALEQAASLRKKDNAAFIESETMLKFSISQLDETIPLLSGKASASAFLQASGGLRASNLRRIVSVTQYLSEDKKDKVLSYLQGEESSEAPSAGTQQIIGILKVMHDEMTADLAGMQKDEAEAANAFGELKEAKLKELGVLVKTIAAKEKRSGELALSLSQDKDALDDANTESEDATKYLSSLKASCSQKEKDRDMRAKTRNDEITAISEAMNILSGDEAMETMGKVLRPTSLLQSGGSTKKAPAQAPVKEATPVLSLLQVQTARSIRPAGEVAANADKATKVVTFMIDGMVKTLHDDDVNDEHKKDWCANETASFEQLKVDKILHHEELEKRIEVLTAEIEQLAADIKALEEQINAIDQEVAAGTVQRKKEHDEFAVEYGQMDTARQLIDKAANRLHAFYNPNHAKTLQMQMQKSLTQTAYFASGPGSLAAPEAAPDAEQEGAPEVEAEATEPNYGAALIQVKNGQDTRQSSAVAPPELPDTPTTYVKKASGGVIGLMTQMKEDLSVDMKEAETEEKNAMKDYTRVMKDAQVSRAAAVKALADKKAVKASTEMKLVATKKENELTLAEIQEIKLYLAQLHIECDFLLRNFESRHEARVEEEFGLESTETIVTHGDPPSWPGTEKVYEEEHSANQVDEHFPEVPNPVAPAEPEPAPEA